MQHEVRPAFLYPQNAKQIGCVFMATDCKKSLPPSRVRQEAARITEIAVRSLLYEVSVSPKPGWVDRFDSGAHSDMDFLRILTARRRRGNFFVLRADPAQRSAPRLFRLVADHVLDCFAVAAYFDIPYNVDFRHLCRNSVINSIGAFFVRLCLV